MFPVYQESFQEEELTPTVLNRDMKRNIFGAGATSVIIVTLYAPHAATRQRQQSRILTSHDIPAIPQVEFPSYHQPMNGVRTYYYGTRRHS
jgi:hypothetical protein